MLKLPSKNLNQKMILGISVKKVSFLNNLTTLLAKIFIFQFVYCLHILTKNKEIKYNNNYNGKLKKYFYTLYIRKTMICYG